MIVQELNAIQKRFGYLPADELRAGSAADRRAAAPAPRGRQLLPALQARQGGRRRGPRLPGRLLPPPGAPQLGQGLQALANEIDPTGKAVKVEGVSCLGQCDHAPAVTINDHVYYGLTEAHLRDRIHAAVAKEPLARQHADRTPLPWKIDPYEGQPRYEAVQKLVATLDPATGRSDRDRRACSRS